MPKGIRGSLLWCPFFGGAPMA